MQKAQECRAVQTACGVISLPQKAKAHGTRIKNTCSFIDMTFAAKSTPPDIKTRLQSIKRDMIFLKFDNRAVVKEGLKSAAQIERLILTSVFLQKLG
ncbi:MAG: hypothetical protein J1D88_01180 [Treponema sp.]|nr:hypothetical protein [Treponema sp.]